MWTTAAIILNAHFGPKVGIPAAIGAAFVAISRVEDNEHFLFRHRPRVARWGFIVGANRHRVFAFDSSRRANAVQFDPPSLRLTERECHLNVPF